MTTKILRIDNECNYNYNYTKHESDYKRSTILEIAALSISGVTEV